MNNPNALIQHLLAWIATDTWADSHTYVTNHPLILSDLGGQILRGLQQGASSEAQAKTAAQHLALWAACRQDGIDAAYNRLVGFPPQPTWDLDEVMHQLHSLNRHPDTASQRVAICEQALSHLDRENDEIIWAVFQDEYGAALLQTVLEVADKEATIENALAAMQAAATAVTPQTNAAVWANVQSNLANTYILRVAGRPKENYQQAKIHAQQALTILEAPEQHLSPEQLTNFLPQLVQLRHLARRHLGVALLKLGEYRAAIDALQPCLAYFSPTEHAANWVEIRYRLGDAHYHCQDDDRARHMWQAITYLEEALPGLSQPHFAEEWVRSHHLLGLLYAEYHQGNRADNVEKGIEHLQTAVAHHDPTTDRESWASIHADLGMLYAERFTENRRQNQEDAIQALEIGRSILTPDKYPEHWKINNNLGTTYLQRFTGNRRDNIERAIYYFEESLQAIQLPQQATAWGLIKAHLAYAYVERIADERPDNIERAITYSLEALQALQPQTREWASAHNNAALAWGKRIIGDPEANKRQSILHSEQVLTVYTRDVDALRWAQNKLNLGTMYYELALLTDDPWLTEKAIDEMEDAIDAYSRPQFAERWAMAATNLGMIYPDRFFGDPVENMQQAINLLEEVLLIYTRPEYPERWARTHLNLGVAYARLAETAVEIHGVAPAIAHFQEALTVLTADDFPYEYQQLARNLGNTFAEQKNWADAVIWYERYITISRTLWDMAYSEGGRLAAATAVSDIYAQFAYAHIQLGQYDAALEVLEAGKAQLLADALNQTDYLFTLLPEAERAAILTARQQVHTWEATIYNAESIPVEYRQALAEARRTLKTALDQARTTHPDLFPQPLTAVAIRQLPTPHSALLMPLLTPWGNCLIFIPHGQHQTTTEHIIPLPSTRNTLLSGWMLDDEAQPGWITAYENKPDDMGAWLDTLERVTGEIAETFFAPLAPLLAAHQVERLILIPQGGLQLLPMHAAWREANGQKAYLLDDLIVQIAPSCQALAQAAQRRTPIDSSARLLAIADPHQNLPFAAPEVASVTAQFTAVTTLHQQEAQLAAVLDAESHHIFHFAGHGAYNWEDVQQSGLLCADATLTLHTVQRRLPLHHTQLVVLSACETGLIDVTHSADEYIGLPFAFLGAGVPGVVASLWAVNDLSTMLLMEQFYQHLQQGQDGAAALRLAQLWLRHIPAQTLAARFSAERQNAESWLPRADASRYWRHFATMEPESKPFAHPHFWAAFTFTGA
jgi:CHAT domain-containing protein